MKILKKIFRFYIQASVHVALAVTSLVWITAKELHLNNNPNLLAFIFFASVSGYNFIKYSAISGLNHFRLSKSLRLIQVFSAVCGLATIYFALFLSKNTYLLLGVLIALTFFYAFPLYKQKNLRGITGLKLFFVALVWAGVTVLLPSISENRVLDQTIWLLFLRRFLFVIALTLPFEIRDLTNDDLALGTLPQRMGILTTKFIGVLLLVLVLWITKMISADKCFDFGISITTILLSGFIIFSKKNQTQYYASFWVEAVPIIWAGIIFLCEKI